MSKVVGLGGRSFVEYLRDLIDEDWKDMGSEMGKDVHEEAKVKTDAIKSVPNHVPWQYRCGEDAFYSGDSIRACGYDMTEARSRRLWREGWVAACKRHVEARGGRFRGNASRG